MRIPTRLLLLLFLALGLLIPGVDATAQTPNARRTKLREHERRIQEIIRTHRARQEEEEAARKAAEIDARRDGEVPDEEPEPEQEARRRTASSVVMGFKFLNEAGQTDYNMVAGQDETFVTEVYLFNIDQNPIERVRLALDYDKRFIEPLRVFDTSLRSFIADEPDFYIEERDGMILYDADLKHELAMPETVLLRILWRAVRSTPYTGIEFHFDQLERDDQAHTAIYCRGTNILGLSDDPADGVLSGGLMIETPGGEDKVLQGKASELREIYLGSVASESRVGLVLVGPDDPVRVGEDFVVRVVLNNPEGALIDSLNFAVLFDPEVVQVVDRDQFNYIIRGVNIHDGPYHLNFPWDMHKRNEVRNDRGLILYQMALANGASLPSKTVATIQFRALAPATSTDIGFVKGRPGAPDLTSIRYFGYERVELGLEYSRPSIKVTLLPAAVEVAARRVEVKEAEVAPMKEVGVRKLRIER